MASIGKKFGQLRQWTNERMGSSQKTETSDEFKRLEHETDVRRDFTEKVYDALTFYLTSLGKRKETGKAKKLPMEVMAEAMLHFGALLHEESRYGRSLVKFGETHAKIADAQVDYTSAIRDTYVNTISRILHETKEYTQLKAKLERRRLDFDAKLNRVHKSRKENPQLEEETRVAQAKYEESLLDVTNKMIDLNSNEDEQLQDLLHFMDAGANYHKRCLDLLTGLQQSLADIPRTSTAHRFAVPSRSGSMSDVSTVEPSGYSEPPSQAPSERNSGTATPERKLSYASNAGSMVYPMMGANGSSVPAPSPARSHSGSSFKAFGQTAPQPSSRAPQPPAAPRQKQVQVMYDFDAEGPGELSIRKGEVISIVCEIDEGWWEGEIHDGSGRKGMFPSNYVETLPDAVPPPQARRPSTNSNGSSGSGDAELHVPSQQRQQDRPYSAIARRSFVPDTNPMLPGRGVAPPRVEASPAARASIVHASPPVITTAAAGCSTCGCSEFAANAFRKDQCSNCYHRH
ncbi:hypothetical protein BC832DRAFT_538812 [Gaertneriomyces semiglobifer]|nr:hypothetical protein BC832DRAFT_538812 [Gaertneriomyces semiglobifer]